MRKELSKITQDLEQGTITENEARTLLLGLLGVSNSLVADIRNKLNPINNLCAMLRNAPRNLTDDEDINNLIFSEVKQCEKSIEYLSNL